MNLFYITKNNLVFNAKQYDNYFEISNNKYEIIINNNNKFTLKNKDGKISYCVLKQHELIETSQDFNPRYDLTYGLIYKLKYIPEYSLSYKNYLILLNHRCASSAIRSAFLRIENKISENDYKNILDPNKNHSNGGWGLIYNDFLTTLEILKNKPKIIMCFRDPIDHFVSCYNMVRLSHNFSIDNYINLIEAENKKPFDNLNCSSHICIQSSVFMNLGLTFKDIILINEQNLSKFFKQEFNFDYIKKHVSKEIYTINLKREDLTNDQIIKIQEIYKYDYLLKDNYEYKN